MSPVQPNPAARKIALALTALLTLATAARGAAPFADAREAAAFERVFAETPERVVAGRIELQLAPGAIGPARIAAEDRSGVPALDAALAARGLSELEPVFFATLGATERFGDFRDRYFVAHLDPGTDIRDSCLALMELPGVLSAWPVLVLAADRSPVSVVTPDDPDFGAQYYLATNGGRGTLRAKGAWGHSRGDSSVVVAVCDTGCDLDHPDLAGAAPPYLDGVYYTDWVEYDGTNNSDDDGNGYQDDWRGWDFVNVGSGPYAGEDYAVQDNDPEDFEGHGTSVAGCVSAVTDDGQGIAGIGWNTRVLPLRIGWAVEDGEGGMTAITYSTIQAAAFNYARVKGAQVVNLSYGSGYTSSLAAAVNGCVADGVIIVNSAGNDGDNSPDYLADTGQCLDVAATDINDAKADFSDYGAWVDVSAPGVGILTTAIDGYGNVQGTSFSSPIAAGLVALIYWQDHAGVRSSANAAAVRATLLATCDDISAENPGYPGLLGAGRVNAFRALGGGGFFDFPGGWNDFQEAVDFAVLGDTLALRGSVTADVALLSPDEDMAILGGWSEDYETRDPLGNPSTLRGNGIQPLWVLNGLNLGADCVIDGFRLEGGGGAAGYFPDLGRFGGNMLVTAGTPTLRNLVFADADLSDEDDSAGGGFFLANVDLTLSQCRFEGNSARRGGGLGVYGAALTLVDCSFAGNSATHALSGGRDGGAVHLSQATLLGSGLSFSGNAADERGGAIFVDAGSELELADCDADANAANTGGCLFVAGLATLSGGAFSANTAPGGGGLAFNAGGLTLRGLESSLHGDPVATNFGGALYGASGSDFDVRNCSFRDERVALQGAVLYGLGASGSFVNNTVDALSSTILGSAIALTASDLDLRNNHFTNCAGGPPVFASGAPLPTAAYNNFFGNGGSGDYSGFASAGGDAHADPLYADAAAGDFRLLLDSPALDAGDPALLDPDGGRSDIGAHGGPEADPLRPDSPTNLAVVIEGRGWFVDLDWDDNLEADLSGYAVYRDTLPDFQPGAASRVATLDASASGFRDDVPDGDTVFHYVVNAFDADGYASGYSNPASGTGEAETPAGDLPPTRFALHGAFPNPFNPNTTLRFDLPSAARVTLDLVASDGRRVRSVRLGVLPAGRHAWTWDGRDGRGRELAAGVYHLRLRAGSHSDRVKLTLLK